MQSKRGTHTQKKQNKTGNRKSHCMGKNIVIIKQKFQNMVAMNDQIRNEENNQ